MNRGLRQLTERVFYLPHEEPADRPVLGYIRGERYSLAVDAGNSRRHVEKFYAALDAAELRRPDFTVLTHWHWDHTFGNEHFAGKKVYVQKREFDFAMDPWRLFDTSYEHWRTGRTPPWACSIPYFEFVYGDKEILPGIRLVTLPGHSPGSQGVLVNTEKGEYLITGDCIGSYECWETPGHIVGAVHTSVKEYLDTYAKMERMDCQILPGHDGRVLEHDVYPYE